MEKIKYYSKLSNNDKNNELIEQLYNVTKIIEKDYPEHYQWFYNKFIPELDGLKREIIYYEINNIIIGVVFLKKSIEEKKVCTIIVDENYRKLGIGTILLEEAFKFLGTNKPLITMPEYKKQDFEGIILKYEWKEYQVIDSYYSKNKELVFNGYLIK